MTTIPSGLRLRLMTRPELNVILEWAADEGWNPGLHDADAFWATDPSGFIAAERDGRLVAGCSIVAYEGSYGFLGSLIVAPPWRGQGVGTHLWTRSRDLLLTRLGTSGCIGLDTRTHLTDFYREGGFRRSHSTVRFAGPPLRGDGPAVTNVVPLDDLHPTDIVRFDRLHFGVHRTAFLQAWLAQPQAWARAARRGDELLGYGVIRQSRLGYKIGPLFAHDDEVAADIVHGLSACIPADSSLLLDVPERNPAGLGLGAELSLTPVGRFDRMYRGTPPQVRWEGVFGSTTPQLG